MSIAPRPPVQLNVRRQQMINTLGQQQLQQQQQQNIIGSGKPPTAAPLSTTSSSTHHHQHASNNNNNNPTASAADGGNAGDQGQGNVKSSKPLEPNFTKAAKEKAPLPPVFIRDKRNGNDWQRKELLGEGGFARCFRISPIDGGGDAFLEGSGSIGDDQAIAASNTVKGARDCAVKVVWKPSLKNAKQRQKLISEIKIHQELYHPHITLFKNVFEDDENVYIVLEICEQKTFVDLIKKRKRLTDMETRFWMWQLLDGIRYMHRKGYIHRDIKLGNLFLDAKLNLKIGDFGLAAQIEHDGERKKTICGTPNYIAPEILFDTKNGHSFEVDIWSLGVVMYTLLIGKPPFQTKDVKAIYKNIRDNLYQFPSEIPISESAKEIITAFLHPKPENRPSIDDIMEHPYFNRAAMPKFMPLSALDGPPVFNNSILRDDPMPLSMRPNNAPSEKAPAPPQKSSSAEKEVKSEWKSPPISSSSQLPRSKGVEKYKQIPTSVQNAAAAAAEQKDLPTIPQPVPPVLPSSRVTRLKAATQREVIPSEEDERQGNQENRTEYRQPSAAISKVRNITPNFASQQCTAVTTTTLPPRSPLTNLGPTIPLNTTSSPISLASKLSKVSLRERENEEERQKSPLTRVTGIPEKQTRYHSKQNHESSSPSPSVRISRNFEEAGAINDSHTSSPHSIRNNLGNRSSLASSAPATTASSSPASVYPSQSSNGKPMTAMERMYYTISNALAQEVTPPSAYSRQVLSHPRVFITKWIDYTNKYGLSYQLRDGSVGVYFNDGTSIILASDGNYFEYLYYEKSQERGGKTIMCKRQHTLSSPPSDITKKITLLKHFRGFMNDNLTRAFVDQPSNTNSSSTEEVNAPVDRLDFLSKYLRTTTGVVFRLSNHSIQINLFDHTKLILSEYGRHVTYIDSARKMETRRIEGWLCNTHSINSGETYLSKDQEESNLQVRERLVYCQEIISQMLRRTTSSSTTTA